MEVQLTGGFLPLLLFTWLATEFNPHFCTSTSQGIVSQTEEADIPREHRFKVCSENLTVHIKWHKPAGPDVGNETNAFPLGENHTSFSSPSMHAASTGVCECSVFSTRNNLTETGKDRQGTVPSCSPETPESDVKEEIWTGFNFLLGIIFGLAAGTFLYMPIISILLWQCRRKKKGKLTSRQVAQGNQLCMAASVTGAEDLTYVNLRFEKEMKPASSEVIYTEVKPSRQKKSGKDAGAANTGVDVSPKGEGQ